MQQFGAQQSPQGIAALAMGNPAPLQQRVAKGGKDPQTGLPKDLVNALALNIVTNENDAAKRQMAMQQLQQAAGPTGQMPTVVQSLQQQAEQKMQAQAMQAKQQQQGLAALMQKAPAGPVPQGTPQPEAQPQVGIDQLPVEFGMAEGGIVAFNGDERSDVPEYERPYDRMNRKNRGEMTEAEREKERAREALISQIPTGGPTVKGGERVSGSELSRNVDNTMMALPGASASRALSGSAGSARGLMAALTGLLGRGEPKETPAAPAQLATAAVDNQSAAEIARLQRQRSLPQAPAPAATPQTAAPAARPVQAGSGAAPGAAPAAQGLGALLEKSIREDLGRDRDTEATSMVGKQRELMGMDAYQKSLGENISARQAEMDKAKAGRTPEWARGLMALSGAPVRGGIGMMLGQAGSAATKARDEYGAEDTKFSKELSELKAAAAKAQAEGNLQLAKAYGDSYKEVDAARRAAMQSGTSLENTRENVELRKQAARLAAEAKAQGAESKEIIAAEAAFARDPEAAAIKKQLESPIIANNPKKYSEALGRLRAIQASKYAQFGIKLEGAPGAASPGGTPSDVQALLNKYGGK